MRKHPPELDLHLIVDNYSTHKHPKVLSWLKRHKRFHIHFIPTSSSWLNRVPACGCERWFRDITQDRIRNGTFTSMPQLVEAIIGYSRITTRIRNRSCGPRKPKTSSIKSPAPGRRRIINQQRGTLH